MAVCTGGQPEPELSEPIPVLTKGRYRVRMAQGPADITAAQSLRALCFATGAPDGDGFDATCRHMLVYDDLTDTLVCCFRLLLLDSGADLSRSYAAQYYDLSALSSYSGRLAELGRFCVHPDWRDPDILRVAWGALAGFVDDNGVKMLFGCSSFAGTDPDRYLDSFALLRARYLAPARWSPQIGAPEVVRFCTKTRTRPDPVRAMQRMPPLLRTYLLMGGWVGDHAVIDRKMDTLHVFTGLEVDAIPAARQRLLRAIANRQAGPAADRAES